MKNKLGFTLIEILVALAIIGILASVGFSSYQDYVTKARIVEAFEFADASRTTMVLEEATGGNLDNRQLYLDLNAIDNNARNLVSLEWIKGKPGDGLKGYIISGLYLPSANPVYPNTVNGFALEWRDNGEWHCVNASKHPSKKATAPALAAKFLPSACNEGNGPLGQPGSPGKPAQCPPGQDKVTVKLNGVDSAACFPACPTGQSRDQANPQNCQAPATTTATTTPPQTAAASAPAATTSQATTPPAAARQPAPANTPPKAPPAVSQPSTQCHVCDPNAPPELCAVLSIEQTCTYPNNWCVTFVDNHADGTRDVIRRCGNFQKDAYNEWYQGTSDDDKCRERIDIEQTVDFTCTFACNTPNCNQSGRSLRPEEDSLYRPK